MRSAVVLIGLAGVVLGWVLAKWDERAERRRRDKVGR
jgi:hypothetical protein